MIDFSFNVPKRIAFLVFLIINAFIILPSTTWSDTRKIEKDAYSKTQTIPEISSPDGNFHIYGLPVGQGDSWVIQCPSGEITILDMGSSDSPSKGFWSGFEIRNFFRKSYHLIKNVIITHNHEDHYNILPIVLANVSETKSLSNIYISCTKDDLPKGVSKWIDKIDGWKNIRLFNNGLRCGTNNVSCGSLNLCPKDSKSSKEKKNDGKFNDEFIRSKVLSANWGQQCKLNKAKTNKNTDSIVLSLTIGRVKVMMNGDFEDFTSSESENGPTKNLVEFYGKELITDIYHISHHGADLLANKNAILNNTRPHAVMVSANPFHTHRHPRCSIFDILVTNIKSLCKPKWCSGSYCCGRDVDVGGQRNDFQVSEDVFIQKIYTCGEKEDALRTEVNNKYAIYSTTPSNSTLNLIEFYTDGQNWGFKNNFLPRK